MKKQNEVIDSFHKNKVDLTAKSYCPSCTVLSYDVCLHDAYEMNNHNDGVHGVWDRIGASDSANHDATSDNNRLSGPIIGIDLGTSNSCVSLWHTVKNRAKIIKNSSSKSKSPMTPLECVFLLRELGDIVHISLMMDPVASDNQMLQ